MSRLSFLLSATIMGLVLCSSRQTAEAGPVTLGLEAYTELVGEAPATESSSAPVPEEAPRKAAPPPQIQDGLLPTGSMTGSSPSTVAPGGATPPALASPATAYRPAPATRSRHQPDHLFIPPRFLDGIFRPPRAIVSL